MRIVLLLSMILGTAIGTNAQVEWLKDASNAAIPSAPVTGRINGKSTTLKFGKVEKTGYLNFGGPEVSFDHYTIRLRDTDSFITTAFEVDIVLTVRKGETPEGKVFRRISSTSLADQPGPKGNGVTALAEFYTLSMRSRREAKPGQDPFFAGSDSIDSHTHFTGRVELDVRKADKAKARLYVCFDDKLKSCVAGTVDVEVR